MKKMILLISLLTTFSATYAQKTSKKNGKAAPVNDTSANSLLWRISGKGLSKASYIFGTIHMICPDDYLWTDKMKESYEKSDEVCFEMNLDDPSVMTQTAIAMIDTSNKTLKDYFTDEQYKKLSKYLADSLGVQISMFQKVIPIALETMISSKNLDCPSPISYEETLLSQAKKDNKTISGLEDPMEQIALLKTIPADSIIKDILDIIDGKQEAEQDDYHNMVLAYKKQELPVLYETILKSKELGEDLAPFLNDRNKKWVGRIEKKIKQRSVFIAVGAGHLWGNEGVIALLRKEGYTVEPQK